MKEITEEEAREFIAEKAGWVLVKKVSGTNVPSGIPPTGPNSWQRAILPDYFNEADREALFWMHQAEKTLSGFNADLYANLLVDLLQPHLIDGERPKDSGAPHLSWPGVFQTLNASVSNRAKTFLAVHGYKLKETK